MGDATEERGAGVSKFYHWLLPFAGRYAYDDGTKEYKWYDVLCYWLVLAIPTK